MAVAKTRRDFLALGLTGVSGAWLSIHWPEVLAAATHAHQATTSGAPAKFEFFSPEQATEIEAFAARIIPTTDTPGAHEAGVIFFIDRALLSFAKDAQKTCIEGLADLQAHVAETFPGTAKFSALATDQQDQILRSLDEQANASASGARVRRARAGASSFFEAIRAFTIMGFLIDPESDRRGNQGAVGWKVIGRDPSRMFQPPFGYYDKDYPGWQPAPSAKDKANS